MYCSRRLAFLWQGELTKTKKWKFLFQNCPVPSLSKLEWVLSLIICGNDTKKHREVSQLALQLPIPSLSCSLGEGNGLVSDIKETVCNTGESGLSLGATSHANHHHQNCLEIEYKTKEPFSNQFLDFKFLLQSLLPVVQSMLSGLVCSNMKQYKTCWESWFAQIWNNTKYVEKAGLLK